MAFENFVDRVCSRMESWSLRFLSMGGKKVMIKAVLQSLLVYAM